jgi:Bacterial Ig domain
MGIKMHHFKSSIFNKIQLLISMALMFSIFSPIATAVVASDVEVLHALDSFTLTLPKRKAPVTVTAPGVLGNDKDAEGKALTMVGTTVTTPRIIELPQRGGKVTLYADGRFTYEQTNKCFYGTRSFTYQATDGQDTSSPATVTLTTKRREHEHNRHVKSQAPWLS